MGSQPCPGVPLVLVTAHGSLAVADRRMEEAVLVIHVPLAEVDNPVHGNCGSHLHEELRRFPGEEQVGLLCTADEHTVQAGNRDLDHHNMVEEAVEEMDDNLGGYVARLVPVGDVRMAIVHLFY